MSNPLQVVDISEISSATASSLLEAATSQGFLFVEGHDFEQDEVDKLFEISRQFFELPTQYKQQYVRSSSNHGYVDYGGENLDPTGQKNGDPKEGLNLSGLDFVTGLTHEPIPDWFEQDAARHLLVVSTIQKMYRLSIKILRILAVGLQIEDTDVAGSEWFTAKYDPAKASGSTFRLLHYPGQKSLNPEAVIRAGAHTDYGSMTLLFQKEGQEGLEIYSPVSKAWEAVPYVPPNTTKYPGKAPPIVVNIGDQLSYWSAGLLRSTVHRVKFPSAVQETGQDRLSVVFFSHPNDNALLTPFPSPLTKNIKGRGANKDSVAITAKQHLDKRLAATYK